MLVHAGQKKAQPREKNCCGIGNAVKINGAKVLPMFFRAKILPFSHLIKN